MDYLIRTGRYCVTLYSIFYFSLIEYYVCCFNEKMFACLRFPFSQGYESEHVAVFRFT